MAQNGAVSAKQIKAIDCLLASPSVTAAVECANVPRRTLYNWLADEDFKRELDAAQRALVATAARRLAHGLEKTITTVLSLAESSEDEAIRLRAALAVPTMLRELHEQGDLADRLAMLEDAMRAINGKV